jgi:hypothetical protein
MTYSEKKMITTNNTIGYINNITAFVNINQLRKQEGSQAEYIEELENSNTFTLYAFVEQLKAENKPSQLRDTKC